jgi:post-segregation antitoxin (ccd killing protein)
MENQKNMLKQKNSERISTMLSKETVNQLIIEAQRRGLSVSGLIRTLILEELRKKRNKD